MDLTTDWKFGPSTGGVPTADYLRIECPSGTVLTAFQVQLASADDSPVAAVAPSTAMKIRIAYSCRPAANAADVRATDRDYWLDFGGAHGPTYLAMPSHATCTMYEEFGAVTSWRSWSEDVGGGRNTTFSAYACQRFSPAMRDNSCSASKYVDWPTDITTLPTDLPLITCEPSVRRGHAAHAPCASAARAARERKRRARILCVCT